MSEPTYKIVTEHDPAATYNPWSARIFRLSDDAELYVGYGDSEQEALGQAQARIAVYTGTEQNAGRTLYATEDGTITDQVPA